MPGLVDRHGSIVVGPVHGEHEPVPAPGPQDVQQLLRLRPACAVLEGDLQEVRREQELARFAGVREFPMRVKCAILAWHALKWPLDGEGDEPVTTEWLSLIYAID